MNRDLLTEPEAAAILRLKPQTLRVWRSKRKIPFVKLNRAVRYRRSDIEGLIALNIVPAAFHHRTDQ